MERRTGFAALVSELSFRRVGLLSEAGGPYLLGLGSQRWRLRLSFRRFEVRLWAGVIRSQSVLSLAGSGFGPPSEISYRGLKLSRVPAAFGRFQLRRLTDLPQVAQPSGGLPPVIRPA